MIRQKPGDVLEVYFEGSYYYLVVVTKIYQFGGNVIYAFHGDGSKILDFKASPELNGFNICTDLLLPKKEGEVKRIGTVENTKDYQVSKWVKSCVEHRPGFYAKKWFMYSFKNPDKCVFAIKRLSNKQAIAMDTSMSSFDLTTKKILNNYTPDQNPFIDPSPSLLVTLKNWFSKV